MQVDDPLTLHGLFEAQAARTPEAEAVVFEGHSLTYGELNTRADWLAAGLTAQGVGPESRVGIAMGRSLDLAVALIGTLKAGAAFVPLDPAYPQARLDAMRRDAGIGICLDAETVAALVSESTPHPARPIGRGGIPISPSGTEEKESLRGRAGVDAAARPVDANTGLPRAPASEPRATPAMPPPGEVRADPCQQGGRGPEKCGDAGAAYVIYTSGSTGEPRGVVVEHRSVVNHALDAARRFALQPGDRVLQFASLSFDIAIEEMFPAWASGASVVFRGEEIPPPAAFASGVEEQGITVLDLPTAYWHAWVAGLAEAAAKVPRGLRLVVVGGEEALTSSFATWLRVGGDCVRWINTYGPTEATVVATAHEPGRGVPETIPIGTPIANVQVHILDARLRPLPIGVPGELCIGGRGIARGYLGRPGMTAGRFVPDPFGEAGSRLYRTGDRARWRADGTLEFLGRLDDQVKVRGFRVEPGEVESALLALPGVREAAVAARDEALVAYIVPREGCTIDAVALRRSLRDRLPRHLVPSAIVELETLPLTPSGKVDRAALPAPGRLHGGRPVVVPRDGVESRLLVLWREIFPGRAIGVTDDFFDLGGHSLLALRLLARVEAEFDRRLPLASLFRGATIEDLAALLKGKADAAWSPLVLLNRGGPGLPFFCVHPVDGTLYRFHEMARRIDDRPFYGIQAIGLDDDRPTPATVEATAAAYIEAVREVQPEGPYHFAGWSLGGLVAFEMARQLVDAGYEVATVVILDTYAPEVSGPDIPPRLAKAAAKLAVRGPFEVDDPRADPLDDGLVLAAYVEEMAKLKGVTARELVDQIRGLDLEGRRLLLLRHLTLDKVFELEAGPWRVRRLIRAMRALTLAGLRYRPPRPYPGRLVIARAAASGEADPDRGWGRLAKGGVASHPIPGAHVTMLAPPGVEVLAQVIRAELDRAEGDAR
ncbi:MAG TPA: amino acid adenylation domain-containing protein [Isosphaeraceae bacterium]